MKTKTMGSKHELETALEDRGYRCPERKKFDAECAKRGNCPPPPRFTYTSGTVRVLTESASCPWWTVQKMSNGRAEWFVDFPVDVPVEAVFSFIEGVS